MKAEMVGESPKSSDGTFWQRQRLQIAIFAVALLVYAATSADRMLKQSAGPHFVYQADALLHGQYENRLPPPNDNDWITFEGKSYVCFPPFPAVLMMPFVAFFGIRFNDVLFTLPFAALNVLLMFLVLRMLVREGQSSMSERHNLWLTGLFAFGTIHYPCSVLGQVWFTAHIVGLTLTLLFILAATRARHPFLSGLLLVLAFDTRVNLAFTAGYFLLQLIYPRQPDGGFAAGGWKEITRKLALFFSPVVVIAGAQMIMNAARFQNVFEFGHSYIGGPAGNRVREHGLYAYHYFEWNLKALLIKLPTISKQFPFFGYDPDGMSIFITTPVFIYLFWPKLKPWIYPILWATVVPALLPALFYQNSGYVQFGFRFALDVTPYLIMLLAVGGLKIFRPTKALIIVGALVNLAGAIVFKRTGPI